MKLSNPYRCADHRLRVTRPVSPVSFKVLDHKPWNPCYLVSIHAIEGGCRDPQRLENFTIDFGFVGNVGSSGISIGCPEKGGQTRCVVALCLDDSVTPVA